MLMEWFYITISLISLGLAIFLLGKAKALETNDKKRYYFAATILVIVMIILDLTCRFFEYFDFSCKSILLHTLIVLYFSASCVTAYFWMMYSEELQISKIISKKIIRIALLIPLAILIVIGGVAIYHGWLCENNDAGYHRGFLFYSQIAIAYLYIFLAAISAIARMIFNKGFREKHEYLTIASMAIYPIIFMVMQCVYDNSSYLELGLILGLYHAYIYMNSFERERYKNYSKIISYSKLFEQSYFIDLETGLCEEIIEKNKNNDENQRDYYKKNILNFEEVCRDYIDNEVYEDDKEMLRLVTDREYIKSNLKSYKQYYDCIYREQINGKIKWYKLYIILQSLNSEYEPSKALLATINVDDEMQKEEAQRLLLIEALDEANSANAAKSNFLSNISHEIRTPMNAIVGYTTLADVNFDNQEKLREYISKIKVSSTHLLDLINKILDMSKIESGKVELDNMQCDIVDIIDTAVKMNSELAYTKSINLSYEFNQVLNKDIYADKLRIGQIAINLISNAVKYTNEFGNVSVTLTEIIKNTDYSNYVLIVEDDGIGMTNEFVERIFEPFERERNSTDSGVEGTGLGLAITKKIIDLMDGSIEIESETDKGTKITVSLEFKKNIIDNKPIARFNDLEVTKLSGKKGLLVEDNEINQEIAIELLKLLNISVDVVDNGQKAIDLLNVLDDDKFDFILMDIQMPVLDGYETTKCIRSMEGRYQSIPIIAMTANAFSEDIIKEQSVGINGHISKPIEMDKLISILQKLI